MRKWHSEIKDRIQRGGFRQRDVAEACGIDQTYFSMMLRGRMETADDFETVVGRVLLKMERAEEAADRARAKVMAEV